MTDVPVLTTARLRLRGHRRDDFAASAAMWGTEDVTRFIGGTVSTPEDSWARMLRHVGHWTLLGFGYWVVEDRETGAFLGEIGFGDFRREMTPRLDGMAEIGWVLAPAAHGRGVASEAVAAALAWGGGHLPSPRTCCIIAPGNARSIRVAQKAGYTLLADTIYKTRPTLLFTRG